jgi:DNA modification methylase
MPRCTPPLLDLKIVERRLDELRVEGRAVRRHSAAQIEAIAASIRQFGFLEPLLIDESGAVIVGKARLAAARVAGLVNVPTMRIDHLSAAEKRVYRLAANKLCEIAGYDRDELALEFQELSTLDLDFRLELTGFSTPEIETLVFGEDALGEDEAPIVDGPAVSELGDLWILGSHKLLCADSTERHSYQILLGDELAGGVFTDPPYNVPVNGHVRTGSGHREFAMASGEMTDKAFADFLTRTLGLMAERCKPGAVLYGCMDWRHASEMLAAAKANRLDLLNLCVWNKGQGGMGSFYRSQHELVFVLKRPGAAHANFVELGKNGRNRTNVWDYPGANASAEGRADLGRHPTPKPVAMVADALLDSTRASEVVLDPFCGGGTILIAADRVERCARAIELDPTYVDAAVRRWESETGQSARCARTGLTFAERGERADAKLAQPVSIRQRQRKEAADV